MSEILLASLNTHFYNQVLSSKSTTEFVGHLVYCMSESWYEKESKENEREGKRRGWNINNPPKLL